MAKQVILAVAGAGKTYHICNSIDKEKKNLILAYTHENIRNIRKELLNAFGCIPELTRVMTFDSFVYRYILLPYEPSILSFYGQDTYKSKGITTTKPEPKTIDKKPNYKYISKDKFGHYITKNGFYYCDNISKLIMSVKKGRTNLIKEAAANLNQFYNQIFIDEFQDFREYDYELITALSKEIDNILLVGDYNQHSVSAVNNTGKPYKKGKVQVSYDAFKQELLKLKYTVDETTMQASRRCPENICNYVSNKLGISITHNNNHEGEVLWVDTDIEDILEDDSIIKLIHKDSAKYDFRAINWSYSKGDTFDNVCVVLTDKFENLDSMDFNTSNISQITINQLYVAMTRTKGNLYIIKYSDFKKIKDNYYK